MNSIRWLGIVFSVLVLCLPLFGQTVVGGTVRVETGFTLPSSQRQPLPGATVTLFNDRKEQVSQGFADDTGLVEFANLSPGNYIVQTEMSGFKTIRRKVTVVSGQTAVVTVELPLEELTTAVEVSADTQDENQKKVELPNTIREQLLKSAPLVNERFQDALPLVPGVIRGPDGLLSLNGARPNQSGLLVNSVNVTDPVTGQYAMELPIEAIESLQVHSNPYSAEFGKFTGAVTTIETRQGSNEWKFLVTNFFPRLRWRDGTVMGLESVTPRVAVSGPLVRNRLWFSQNLEYRFIRTRVPSLPDLQNDTVLETFDSFTRIDWDINDVHHVGGVFSLYPQNLTYVNLDTFHPQEVTPNFRQRGFFLALNERAILNLNSLLETTFSIKQYDAYVWGNSLQTMSISPEGWRGGFFNRQDRYSRRYEFSQTYTFNQHHWLGLHDPKMGYVISRSEFHGEDDNRPVLIIRQDGTISQRIDFLGSPLLKQNVTEETAFFEDRWQMTSYLTINGGIRFDHDSLAREYNFAPRFGFALLPIPSNTRTVVRGGIGLFYDKIPLNAGVFPQYQELTTTYFGPDGQTVISGPVTYQNVIGNNNLENPYSLTWNLQVDHELFKGLLLRFGYQERNQKDDLIITLADGETPRLMLSNQGSSAYKEWLFSVHTRFGRASELSFSYVHSRAEGDLNYYETYLGNYHYPVFRHNEYGPQPYDVPNRFLISGTIEIPLGLILAPVLDVHTGFPYSLVDENQDFVSRRNRGGRFPYFMSLDFQLMKRVAIPFFGKVYHTRIGLKVFNITNHWNPRDVQNNIDSPHFGTYYNSVGRVFRGKFEIDF